MGTKASLFRGAFLFVLFLVFKLSYCNAQSKGFNANKSTYLAVLDSITNGITEPGYAIYIDDYKITEEDKEWLNIANKKDFITVKAFNKNEARLQFGEDGEKGAVLLTPFTDELLDVKYYTGITNGRVLSEMIPLLATGEIKNNPVLVVDGKPLRGKDIQDVINSLGEENIYTIYLLKKKAAFGIYGIRSLPGVLIILTNEYNEKHPKLSQPKK